ncbi:E3 ubiquitin-protein ligase RNF181 homolog [Linum perenne]
MEEFLIVRGEQREGEAEEAEEAWSTEMSGASDLAIGKLERLESIEGEDECCSICLERMSLLRKFIRLGCKHVFHESYLVTWLCTSTYCPLCRFCVSE